VAPIAEDGGELVGQRDAAPGLAPGRSADRRGLLDVEVDGQIEIVVEARKRGVSGARQVGQPAGRRTRKRSVRSTSAMHHAPRQLGHRASRELAGCVGQSARRRGRPGRRRGRRTDAHGTRADRHAVGGCTGRGRAAVLPGRAHMRSIRGLGKPRKPVSGHQGGGLVRPTAGPRGAGLAPSAGRRPMCGRFPPPSPGRSPAGIRRDGTHAGCAGPFWR